MIKRLLVPATFATCIAAVAFVGCGGSSTTSNNPSDAGGGGGSGSGSGSGGGTTPDASTKADGGAGPTDSGTGNPPLPDGSIYPHGNQLVPSTTLTLDGVTSDDYAIYTDSATNTVSAIALAAGSKPISLGPVDTNNDVIVSGKVVFIGTSISGKTGAGSVSIWKSGATAAAPLSTTAYFGAFSVSSDASHVAFFDGITASVANVSAAAADGTGKVTLLTGIDITQQACNPNLAYAGTNVVVTYCAAPVDAGASDAGASTNVATLSLFAPGSTTPVVIAQNVQSGFTADPAGKVVVSVGATGTVAYPITGSTPGTAVAIDTAGALGAVTASAGVLTTDGSHLVYTTTAQALKTAATTSPAGATQLVASGFSDVYGLSGDGKWLIGTLAQAQQGGGTDSFFASATTAGTATALSSATTGAISGDLFTVDSTHVLFQTAAGQTGGTLNAASVTAPGTPTVLGQSAHLVYGTSAAKVVFNANYNGKTGGADLLAADTAQTAAPAVVVTAADPTFYLNSAKTVIVYTWSYQSGASAGLWTLPVP